MGLPPQLRLRKAADYERLRRHGKAYRHRLLLLSVLPNDLPHNRYGFAVGKKVGKAVVRNRVRRLLKEAVRALHPTLHPGYDVVIVAHPPSVGQPLAALQRTVDDLLRQAGLQG
jgi:ribonuclease P protein component